MTKQYLLLLVSIVLLIACDNRKDDVDTDSKALSSEQKFADDVDNPTNAVLNNAPKIITKNPQVLRQIVINFLKKKGESNRSIAAILGQAAAETEDFRYMHELGDYNYLLYLEGKNGNKYKGDGPKYKGRGYIHLTGRGNYDYFGKKSGYDLVSSPVLAERSDVALAVMNAYLQRKKSGITGWQYARRGDVLGLTKHINGGTNGLGKRRKYTYAYLRKLNSNRSSFPSVKAARRL